MIALDTTAIIDLFKGEPSIKKVIEPIREPLVSTQMNYLEIMSGLDVTVSKHRDELDYYEVFFDEVILLPLDRSASKKTSEVLWKLKKQGKNIGRFDCVISGILLSNSVNKIITRNSKHFEHIPNLKVISY